MLGRRIACALSLALSLTAAAPTFLNTGTLSGWDVVVQEHNGKVEQVARDSYKGSKSALKMTQIYDPKYNGRYHSEVVKRYGYKRGDKGTYSFAFKLPDDWEFTEGQSYNLAQFLGDFRDSGGCDKMMPTSMVGLGGNQLYTRVKAGTVCHQVTDPYRDLATITPGVWHTIKIEAYWQTNKQGYYRMWFDGKKVLDKNNLDTTTQDDRTFAFRVGLYAGSWHDEGVLRGNQGTREVMYDAIKFETT